MEASSSNQFISVSRQDNVGVLILDRPARANAYHQPMLQELEAAFVALTVDPPVRVLVITGGGAHFCAGADRGEIAERGHQEAFRLRSAAFFDRLEASPQIIIAALNGPAVGGGLELALASDLRLAAPEAFMALPEVSLGLLPAAGGTFRLPRLVGLSLAKAIVLGGKRLTAAEALDAGLVLDLVPREQLLEAALALAHRIASCDPLTLRLAKRALELGSDPRAGESYALLSQALLYELAHARGKV